MLLKEPSESTYAYPIKNKFSSTNDNCSFLQGNHYFTPKSAKETIRYTGSELVEQFLSFTKDQKQLSPKTVQQYESQLRCFLELWTLEELHEIDRENAELLLGLLYKMPKNPRKNKKLHGYKGIELLKRNEEIGGELISRETVKKHIHLLSTFFNWLKSRGHVDENPFYKLTVRKGLRPNRRYQLSSRELCLIFKMRDYQRGNFRHPYYYWLPLLLRFTGARLNELCQLYKSDIVIADGIWGIRISAMHPDQRLKNDNSMRFIPLHQAIISRGFLRFVKSCSTARLFDELPLVEGYYSHNASKWLARRRKVLGLGTGKDGHSFRHSFVDELKQAGVAIEMIKELVGHSSNSITTSVYSRAYQPELLVPAINKLDDSHVAHIKPYC